MKEMRRNSVWVLVDLSMLLFHQSKVKTFQESLLLHV